MALDTLANIKARLGISGSEDDSLLGKIQSSAEALIAEHTGRKFEGGTFTEDFSAALRSVQLKNYPVANLNVYVDNLGEFGLQTEIPAIAYKVDAVRGIVRSLCGPFYQTRFYTAFQELRPVWESFPGMVRVIYTVSAPVPQQIQEALALLVGFSYRKVKTNQASNQRNILQERVGDSFVMFESNKDDSYRQALDLLEPFRQPSL
ncbi:phage head-tail connector protein [Telmatocola sphagniphila]|uniref:Phage head-tail connector protein n=1 Tax=Telmatocola sphagniphila TaxID=1123043 RepID=A0A8E6B5T3_9BACT|nr:phage head-tail connector protein [Telmatocola sphagniphila]QVL30935.1 phage head-tail connector protein [Telmatocola sphagniphila]